MSKQQDFIRKVARMRSAQKKLAKYKTNSGFEEVRRLEESVDRDLEEMGFQAVKAAQLSFDSAAPRKTDEIPGEYEVKTEG